MSFDVYVGGASSEMARASKWIARLRSAGINVVSTWVETINNVGDANPETASKADRMKWAILDLEELQRARVFWVLTPEDPITTIGAWVELGFSLAEGKTTICSGPTTKSIFCALGTEIIADEEAFKHILELHEESKSQMNLNLGGG